MNFCAECGRPARWVWTGNNYEPPKFVCGYHKRAYIGVILWGEETDAVEAKPASDG